MTKYIVTGTDSAGKEFVLGSPELALSALEVLTSVEKRALPVGNLVVRDAQGNVVERAELIRLAEQEVRAKLVQRARAEGKLVEEEGSAGPH